jgi:D-alanyl-D-alanine carboxypeptidase (penicillin-binding protein 5/6)
MNKIIINKYLLIFFVVFNILCCSLTYSIESPKIIDESEFPELSKANFYFLIDPDTREILLQKNADLRLAPSSMTKVMTAYVVFDQVKNGRIKLTNQCLIGRDAWKKRGSSMFLNYGDIVSIDDLIQGLLAVSGNDAAIALAETTAGGFGNFISLMNSKAKELGLKNSHFKNPHGLNEEGHYMSLRDLAVLMARIYSDFPEFSHYLAIQEFSYHGVVQGTRNPLLKNNYDGAVGGKTGHTNEGGYGMVGIVKRDNRRLIAVVNKTKTPKQRAILVTELMNYGFEKYKKITLFKKGESVARLKTAIGKRGSVSAVALQEVAFNIPREKAVDFIDVKVKYKSPLIAPIQARSNIAELLIDVKGYKKFQFPLVAKNEIKKAGFIRKMIFLFKYKMSVFLGFIPFSV